MSWQGWAIVIGGSWLVLAILLALSLGKALRYRDERRDRR